MRTWEKRITLVLILIFLTCLLIPSLVSVKADSSEPIIFSSGLAVYSPLNISYNSYSVLVNISFGCPYGTQSSLNYSIDGKYQDGINMHFPSGSEPWTVPNYSPSNYYLLGSFYLPPLPDGPHQISFAMGEEANNYSSPPSSSFQQINGTNNYVATWVNTVSFTISSKDAFPTPTPTFTPTPSSTPTVPESSWLAILPLFVSMLFVVVKLRNRKTKSKRAKLERKWR